MSILLYHSCSQYVQFANTKELISGLNLQMKLLNLYIKRAQTGSGAGDTAADMPGQS